LLKGVIPTWIHNLFTASTTEQLLIMKRRAPSKTEGARGMKKRNPVLRIIPHWNRGSVRFNGKSVMESPSESSYELRGA
jgi:hypothetical protein